MVSMVGSRAGAPAPLDSCPEKKSPHYMALLGQALPFCGLAQVLTSPWASISPTAVTTSAPRTLTIPLLSVLPGSALPVPVPGSGWKRASLPFHRQEPRPRRAPTLPRAHSLSAVGVRAKRAWGPLCFLLRGGTQQAHLDGSRYCPADARWYT